MPTRKKGLKRTGRIRPRSPKGRKQDRNCADLKDEFRAEHPACWNCGGFYRVETHHIAHRHGHPERDCLPNLARLCSGPGTENCHGKMHSGEIKNPKAYCLALKQLHDRENYDRSLVLRVWGKADTCVTETEVLWEVAEILRKRKKARENSDG